jgi:UDP-N-acetylmuramoyl-tripeptide--D-alanyl-D-alanine ligase
VRLSVAEVARTTGAQVLLPAGAAAAAEAPVTGVSIDTRSLAPGQLFVAIAGERADGHSFLGAAFAAGAPAALVSRPGDLPAGAAGPLLLVDDVVAALARLAARVRDEVDPAVVGITGSTGKTTTKELVAAVAAVKYPTVAAHRSENNELGVPLTLLRVAPDTAVLVCELGARGPGQIAELCAYVRPTIGVVTNVGVTHYELFGSVEAIVAAKSELPAALPSGGVAVLNADDPAVAGMAAVTRAEVVTYGTGRRAWVVAEEVELDRRGRPSFRIVRGAERARVALQVSGRHQVHNALAAAATGLALGLSLDDVAAGLASAQAPPWRMEVSEHGGVVVVNDAYNANPTSVASALETCAAMVPEGGRLLAVLGPMAELGAIEAAEHERIGRLAGATADRLIAVGEPARLLAAGARRAGLADVTEVVARPGEALVDEVLAALGPARPGDVVLVKASRVAGLEQVAARLCPPGGAAGGRPPAGRGAPDAGGVDAG